MIGGPKKVDFLSLGLPLVFVLLVASLTKITETVKVMIVTLTPIAWVHGPLSLVYYGTSNMFQRS